MNFCKLCRWICVMTFWEYEESHEHWVLLELRHSSRKNRRSFESCSRVQGKCQVEPSLPLRNYLQGTAQTPLFIKNAFQLNAVKIKMFTNGKLGHHSSMRWHNFERPESQKWSEVNEMKSMCSLWRQHLISSHSNQSKAKRELHSWVWRSAGTNYSNHTAWFVDYENITLCHIVINSDPKIMYEQLMTNECTKLCVWFKITINMQENLYELLEMYSVFHISELNMSIS